MVQRIQSMRDPRYAEEALMFSSANQGLVGMVPSNPGMPNLSDGATGMMLQGGGQMMRKADYDRQNAGQNTMTAINQQLVAQQGMKTKMMSEQATGESAEKQFKQQYLANVMDAFELNKGMNNLNNEIDRLGPKQFTQNIAISKQMGESPDLAALMSEANQYG